MRQFTTAFVLLLTGCTTSSPEISAQLAHSFADNSSAVIDLAQLGPSSWQRVCVLTPYTDDAGAEQILGFKWSAEGKTSIATNDGINVLVFTQGTNVVAYAEHPRNAGDLSDLKPSCLQRDQAKLVRREGSHGWVYLVAQNPS